MEATNNKKTTSPRGRVIRHIRDLISKGDMQTGDILGSEQSLCDAVGVARTTVRAALEDLEKEGRIRQVGRRRVICSPEPSGLSALSNSVAIFDALEYKKECFFHGSESQILVGLTDAVIKAGFSALTMPLDKDLSESSEQLVSAKPFGLVVLHYHHNCAESMQHFIERIRSASIPVAVYGSGDKTGLCADTVSSDHRLGSYMLTKWLLKRGRKRILRYWRLQENEPAYPSWLRARDEGYEQAMREEGLEPLPQIEHNETIQSNLTDELFFESKVHEAIGRICLYTKTHSDVDAVMCSSDGVVYSIAAAFRKLGFVPNQDIDFVGYDNYTQECPDRRWEPAGPVATIDKRNTKLGTELMDLISARSAGQLPSQPQHRILDPVLIEYAAYPGVFSNGK